MPRMNMTASASQRDCRAPLSLRMDEMSDGSACRGETGKFSRETSIKGIVRRGMIIVTDSGFFSVHDFVLLIDVHRCKSHDILAQTVFNGRERFEGSVGLLLHRK